MLGIILWSCARRRRAVVWCEDQGPLAYLRDDLHPEMPGNWPEQGQTVELETEHRGDLRMVTRLSLLAGRVKLAEQMPRIRTTPVLSLAAGRMAASATAARPRKSAAGGR